MEPIEKHVALKNDDSKLMSFSILPRDKSSFDVTCGSYNLMPGEETNMVVRFQPRTVGKVAERIQMEVNGLSKMDLVFRGEGAEFKLDLGSNTLRNINFGALRVGQVLQKTVKIVNKSVIPATFYIGPPAVVERLRLQDVELSAWSGPITLQPKAVQLFDVRYAPRQRRAAFTEELLVIGPGGIQLPLLLVSGACHGTEVKLESDFVAFGAIVHKSSTSRKLQIINTGDIGVRFRWDVSQFYPDFTISPAEGYISAGMDVSLEIVFNPLEVKTEIRYERLFCDIEGSSRLYLTLTGSCILPPAQNEILKFTTPVRQAESKPIMLVNRSAIPWHIRPVIEGAFWSGSDIIDLDPGQNKAYEVTYLPVRI